MCAFNYRFVPAVRRAREMLEAGELGDVHHFRGTYRQSWGADPGREGVWRFDASQAGGGALGDLASHVIDLSRYLVGDVTSVAAQVATFVPGRTVDDAAAAAVAFANGAIGTIEATRFATGDLNRFTWEVNGSKGSLAFDLERPSELYVNGTRTLVNPDGWWPPGHVLGWEHTLRLRAAPVPRRGRRARHRGPARGDLRGRPARERGVRRDRALRTRGPAREPGLSGAQSATARPLSAAS